VLIILGVWHPLCDRDHDIRFHDLGTDVYDTRSDA